MRIGILAATALLMLAGCNGGEEAGNNSAGTNEAANAVEPVDAAAAAEAQAAFDALVPPYPGAQQVQTGGTAGTGVGGSVTFRTPDSAPQVVDFYSGAAERAGFNVEDRTNLGGGMAVSMTARRGASDLITVSASRVGDITQVQIMAAAATR
jgi:hypothetical protein